MSFTLPERIICGYFDCSIFGDLKESPKRVRTLYEIEYYLDDGRFTYTEGVAYPIKKGHIRIGVPGERCNSLLPFKTKYVKFSADGEIGNLLQNSPRYFKCHHPLETEKMLDELISLYQSENRDGILLSGKLLVFISSVISDSKQSSVSNTRNDAVQKAKKYIAEHISAPLTLLDIAKAVNLSPNYFHSLFVSIEGITPREYLNEQRLSLACELLRTTSNSHSDIAERCGFCNQQYMSLLFKKKKGISPKEYRKNSGRNYLI